MALELPNPRRQIVKLVEILASTTYNDTPGMLTLALGKDIAGKPVDRRPRADAASARRRHDGLGQVGRRQRDDPVAALQGRAASRCG